MWHDPHRSCWDEQMLAYTFCKQVAALKMSSQKHAKANMLQVLTDWGGGWVSGG